MRMFSRGYSSLTNKHYFFPPFDASFGLSMGVHFFEEEHLFEVTNSVESYTFKGVTAYDIKVRETNTFSRVFITEARDVGFRTSSVLPYDTQEWSHVFYGDVPDWLSGEEQTEWYRDRRRDRIELHFTLIPCSSSNMYYQNIYIEHTNYLAHVNDPVYPVDTNFENIISGDSGNPQFLVAGNQVIMLNELHYAIGGPFLTSYAAEIQEIMDRQEPGYSLTFFDFSKFSKIIKERVK